MKMEIFHSLYELKGKHQVRQGALLKIAFPDGKIGYADCHPWTELGDAPLSIQLINLSKFVLTPLLQRSLFFARQDAEARASKISLFEGLSIPPSHYLMLKLSECYSCHFQSIVSKGYKCIKIKMKNEVSELKKILKLISEKDFRIRLDFNEGLSHEQFIQFLEELDDLKKRIEFYEDPFPFHSEQWIDVQKKYGVMLACDAQASKALGNFNGASILVIKPAIQDEEFFLKRLQEQKIVMTSYLDHPIGQLFSAWVASRISKGFSEKMMECGLTTHLVYDSNVYSSQLDVQNSRLLPGKGYGIGFDSLLEKENWQSCYAC